MSGAHVLTTLVLWLKADAQRVVQANQQIVSCRRVLKWTYAYGFYKFDTLTIPIEAGKDVTEAQAAAGRKQKQAIDARKILFEFLQNDAETSLEKLSGAVELNLKRFIDESEFWRLTKKAGRDSMRREVRICGSPSLRVDWACTVHLQTLCHTVFCIGDCMAAYKFVVLGITLGIYKMLSHVAGSR